MVQICRTFSRFDKKYLRLHTVRNSAKIKFQVVYFTAYVFCREAHVLLVSVLTSQLPFKESPFVCFVTFLNSMSSKLVSAGNKAQSLIDKIHIDSLEFSDMFSYL